MKHLLEIDGVQLNFGLRNILSDVYVRCDTGMVTGLLGRNGSGKSCFMQVAFGTMNAYSRSVRCDGKHIACAYKARKLVSYLPQFYFVPAGMKVINAFASFGLRVQAFMEKFPEYADSIYKRMDELSGGQRRMIEIYLVLKADTLFTILDEPFSHIMPLHVDVLKEMIQGEKERKGIIVTDHLYKHILGVSDTIYVLNNGKTNLLKQDEELVRWGYLSHL